MSPVQSERGNHRTGGASGVSIRTVRRDSPTIRSPTWARATTEGRSKAISDTNVS